MIASIGLASEVTRSSKSCLLRGIGLSVRGCALRVLGTSMGAHINLGELRECCFA